MKKLYLIAVALFYLYPSSLVMTLNLSRDTLAHWILLLTLIYVYVFFLENKQSLFSKLNLIFLVTISTFLGQETIYILPLGLFLIFLRHKRNLKLSLILAVSLPLVHFLTGTKDYHYKTTLLINPLSSVLHQLYGNELPPEVDSKLGPFFKNHYLLKYQNEFDIDPFHHGGVNEGFKKEDYDQFKKEAVNILFSHPYLFLKNRF